MIEMMEYHNRALEVWRERKVQGRILIHLDAHMDFGWIADRDPLGLFDSRDVGSPFWNFKGDPAERVDIGNFIYPAIKEGMVRKFYWVVPDPVWESRRQHRAVENMLSHIVSLDPESEHRVIKGHDFMAVVLKGVPVFALPLGALPVIDEEVLLDIDTDYMVTRSVTDVAPYYMKGRELPWIWPEELAARIQERRIRAEVVTVAYSVEGGYTPLKYRYLGDVIRNLLRYPYTIANPPPNNSRMRRAFEFWHERRCHKAMDELLAVLRTEPDHAPAHYALAMICREGGEFEDFSFHFARALELNAAYRTPYNNQGLMYLARGMMGRAAKEFGDVLCAVPEETNALTGLADVFSEIGEAKVAKNLYLRSLVKDAGNAAAYSGLGRIEMEQRRFANAAHAFKKASELAPADPFPHEALGRLLAKKGMTSDAMVELKTAKRLGGDGFKLRIRLAVLYLKKRNFHKARRYFFGALNYLNVNGPAIIAGTMRRIPRNLSGSFYDIRFGRRALEKGGHIMETA